MIDTGHRQLVTLTGHNPNAVIDVIRARARNSSRSDGNRVALVVEGGSMRGVYTAGALLALHIMGLSALFDSAYGSSAGAVNAAHFLSGVGDTKADTYYRLLADGRFLSLWRPGKIVDIDFFVDDVLGSLRPVEVDLVMKSPTPLWVAIVDFVTARSMLVHAQSGQFPLLRLLKAATALPVLYNRLVDLGEIKGFDAGFVNPIPIDCAIEHGNTHVLVLVPTATGFYVEERRWWERMIFNRRFSKGNAGVQELYARSAAENNRQRDLVDGRVVPSRNMSIATIAPTEAGGHSVSRTTQNIQVLRQELINSARGTLRLFEHSEEPLEQYILKGVV